MVAKKTESVEPATVSGWHEALEELHRRIAHHFARSDIGERAHRYLVGLLGRVERKRTAGGLRRLSERHTPRASSAPLDAAKKWDADLVRDETSETTSWSTWATRIVACPLSTIPAS